jgi:hypothetical protein
MNNSGQVSEEKITPTQYFSKRQEIISIFATNIQLQDEP